MRELELGPLVRYVDESCATIWVKTGESGRVRVTATDPDDGTEHSAEGRTFAVHGHHYALVDLVDLPPGRQLPYTVEIDGERVWPPPEDRWQLPASAISTLDPAGPLRIAFGSCRTSVAHDADGHRTHGVDALQAYALRLAGVTEAGGEDDPDPGDEVRWPDLVLFLGDQVYADELTEEMKRFIAGRRSLAEPPGAELKDYEEYAHLYQLAWTDPANRWLLSTVPSAMIFDDHDVRDDWNTSARWRAEMNATAWWHERIVAALASYWVYQHAGNLSPAERAEDEIWREIAQHADDDEYDATTLLDAFAARVDEQPESYRWSYARRYGDRACLVVVDSRAARVLDRDQRSLLDPAETSWLDAQVRGDVEHLLIGTSLPFLLAPGLHHTEAFSEALAGGGWGDRLRILGDRLRQTVDLEHWAAFQKSFQEVCAMTLDVARGQRGRPPRTVTFLSGDVHHSYVSEARPDAEELRRGGPIHSRVVQAVCSPIRNPLSRNMRFATAALSYGVAGPIGHLVARSAKVPDPPVHWRLLEGPWFDNNIATLETVERGLRMWWATGVVEDGDHEKPRLSVVADLTIDA